MHNIKNILDSLLQPTVRTESWKLNLIKNWPIIVGNLHEKVFLQKINATSVVLGVYDSSWMQELYLLSKLILKKINSNLDRPRIETLRFQCIESSYAQTRTNKALALRKSAAEKENTPICQKFVLKPKELLALHKIKDQQLSLALQGFLQRCQS